jgi:hypothetical protein
MSRGIKGFVAQGMDGRKNRSPVRLVAIKVSTSGSGSYTAIAECEALIYAWGAAGSGALDSGSVASGAGAGAAGYKRVPLARGQVLSWSVGTGGAETDADPSNGNDGGDTTVTLPWGLVLTAGGGKRGVRGASPQTGGLGGQCSGAWDLARAGGNGGNGVTAAGTAGTAGTGGGTPGNGSGNFGGGGAAAGFSDVAPGLTAGGNGQNGNSGADTSTAPGGAGAGVVAIGGTYAGKNGRVEIYLVSAPI